MQEQALDRLAAMVAFWVAEPMSKTSLTKSAIASASLGISLAAAVVWASRLTPAGMVVVDVVVAVSTGVTRVRIVVVLMLVEKVSVAVLYMLVVKLLGEVQCNHLHRRSVVFCDGGSLN